MVWIIQKAVYVSGFRFRLCSSLTENLPAGLEKNKDLRYDEQARKARLFEVGEQPTRKGGPSCRWR